MIEVGNMECIEREQDIRENVLRGGKIQGECIEREGDTGRMH